MKTTSRSAHTRRPHIALLIETSLASGRDVLRGIASYVREHASWSLYHEPHGLTDALPGWLRKWRGDGIIARIQNREMADVILASGLPVVDVLGVVPKLPVPLVHVDDGAVARLAAAHFLERGLRHFAFYGIRGENWSEARYQAFVQAVAPVASGVALYESGRDPYGRRSWERLENHLAHWLAGLPRPLGLFVCSDQRGPHLLEACRRAGLAVPADVAVLGVDNDEPLCEVCAPPLSSIDAGHFAVGYQAAGLLNGLLQGGRAPRAPVLTEPRRVIGRRSTDALAIDDPALRAALQFIRETAHEGLRVDAVAHHVGMSRSVLQRRFRAKLRHSIHDEILRVRIKRAEELLQQTDLPLAAIAERAGFRHQEYMGVVFKARLGLTPARRRETLRQA